MKKIGYSILLAIIMIFTVFTPVHADNTNLIQNEISIINALFKALVDDCTEI